MSDALDLYHWNCQASSALFELVGWFEVAWRNVVNSAVTSRRPAGQPYWLFDPAFPPQPATRAKVQQAIRNVRRGGLAHPAPGQVVAELRQRVADLLQLGEWINPQAANWWRQHTTIGEVLDRHPLSGIAKGS